MTRNVVDSSRTSRRVTEKIYGRSGRDRTLSLGGVRGGEHLTMFYRTTIVGGATLIM